MTSRARNRDSIAKSLCKRQLELVTVSTSVPPGSNPRIVVTTWYGLGHLELESWQRTFLLVPDALDATSRRAGRLVAAGSTLQAARISAPGSDPVDSRARSTDVPIRPLRARDSTPWIHPSPNRRDLAPVPASSVGCSNDFNTGLQASALLEKCRPQSPDLSRCSGILESLS